MAVFTTNQTHEISSRSPSTAANDSPQCFYILCRLFPQRFHILCRLFPRRFHIFCRLFLHSTSFAAYSRSAPIFSAAYFHSASISLRSLITVLSAAAITLEALQSPCVHSLRSYMYLHKAHQLQSADKAFLLLTDRLRFHILFSALPDGLWT